MRYFSSIFTILPNGDNDNEAVLKESQNNFDRPIENGIFFNSKEDNPKFSQIQTSFVTSDYKILQILRVFRGSNTMTFTLHSKFYICACARTVYIPKTSKQILQDNS